MGSKSNAKLQNRLFRQQLNERLCGLLQTTRQF
jgi:hypothetical protein